MNNPEEPSSSLQPPDSQTHFLVLVLITIFSSGFLLFQLELIAGKFLLPWFGGASSVWATALVFFQLLLLAGYAYSHYAPRILGVRKHAAIHTGLVVLSAVLLVVLGLRWSSPLTPGQNWRPAPDANPVLNVTLLLCATTGVPFLLLSTTGPLLQKWYSLAKPQSSVYWLYAVSNAGSLLGLVSYPFLVEPYLRMRNQGWIWAMVYLGFTVCVAMSARLFFHGRGRSIETKTSSLPSLDEHSSPGARVSWFLLPAFSSMLLLGTTNVICSEVAVVPLLWVLPLSIYLVSWILTFQSEDFYVRNTWFPLMVVALAVGFILLAVPAVGIRWQVLAFCGAQFVASVVAHGELRRLRPDVGRLTHYYLWIATGSAVGGLFVVLAAPWLFRSYWEYPLSLFLIAAAMLVQLARDPKSWFRAAPGWLPLSTALAMLLLLAWVEHTGKLPMRFSARSLWIMIAAAAAFLVLRMITAPRQPAPIWTTISALIALAVWCGFALSAQITANAGAIAAVRNFYGVVRVRDADILDQDNYARYLEHGRTTHGLQLLSPNKRHVGTTYYGPNTGVGILLAALPKNAPHRIGVVGLGAGTLATYARPADRMVFYDINPTVIELAASPSAKFTFVKDAQGQVATVLGDARLSLERELQNGSSAQFDVLVLDAFSGDSIPVHLLTVEAFRLYLTRLKSDGVIAVHISNRNLDLESPIAELCTSLNLDAVHVINESGPNKEYAATWILVSPDHQRLMQAEILNRAWPVTNSRHVRVWTDDYSNLVQILR